MPNTIFAPKDVPMNRLGIRFKLFILGFLGAFMLVGLALLALYINREGLRNLNDVFDDTKQVHTLQSRYIAPLFRLRELSLSLVMAPNENFRAHIQTSIPPLTQRLDEAFAQTDDALHSLWLGYKNLLETTRTHIERGFEEGAFINANTAERKQFFALIGALEERQNKQLEKSSSTFSKAQALAQNSKYLLFAGVIILLLLSIFIASYIANNIINSIEIVQKGLKDFFNFLSHKSDTIESRGIELESKDELGAMAKAINAQIHQIKVDLLQDRKLIEEATHIVSALKKGERDARLIEHSHSKELNTLKSVMNEMMDDLERKIQNEISQRSDQEKLLIQQSKLAAMGNMIGNIAHQWRQPLGEINAVLMSLQVRHMYDDLNGTFLNTQIEKCNQITEFMSNTISDFQNFFKPSKEKERFCLYEACHKAAMILHSSLKHHAINFAFHADKTQSVLGYPNEFSQAFLNILSNAKDVLVERKITDPKITVTIKSGEHYVLVKVQDNGGGITEENLERIFEPYFTTKHAKQGAGIGLYMCKTIIEGNMDGILTAYNTDEGACITIKLNKF
jgi:signal transduction histidine kinase